MTTRRISLQETGAIPTGDIHLLPCQIRHDGPAPVSQFFTPESPAPDSKDAQEGVDKVAYFRGRKLLGSTVSLPQGFIGTIYTPSAAQTVPVQKQVQSRRGRDTDSEDDQVEELEELSTWTAKHRFTALTEYGNNAVVESKVLDWIALAHAMHGSDTP